MGERKLGGRGDKMERGGTRDGGRMVERKKGERVLKGVIFNN